MADVLPNDDPTQPTSQTSWAVSLGRRVGRWSHRLGPAGEEMVDHAQRAGSWAVRRGRVVGSHAREQGRRWREPKRLAILIGLVAALCLAIMLALIYAHSLTRRAPRWWNHQLAIDPAAGEAIEMGLMGHLSAVRPADPALKASEPWRSTPWSVSLSESDANAWLNERMPKWMLNRGRPVHWPVEVASLQVKFEEGVIRLGVQVLDGPDSVIAGVSITPHVHEDGSLWLESSGLDIGSLPAPAWAIGAFRASYADSIPESIRNLPEVDQFFGALAGKNAIFPNASVRLDGGRRVRALSVTPKNGRLDLTFRTELAPPRR